ncbi:HI0074 family nucleotidyltransferase substrate-binding subunit [Kyrpidia tusciae]|uniref:Nucleotidyltransferase substrate binding protein, HI0074 family n=1 Tax=Kyrpidia tusciae (strain DSM 2912 / NBRC 15312 / T2) TaxID=562970 RepID=D5WWJ8_KYRT2|nr:HI0074 family nucleotidyltransferase substrate-binding subunit [Kyrpidia tusciae]ADG07763.1 nucleotidyltransferase substrate binding protein, HI0074 family [Kyrpidia tusciae DSM 2912]
MERLRNRLETALRRLNSLETILSEPGDSAIVRDAAIQRFEYTFEAAWKAAQLFLAVVEGIDLGSPKGVIRACREVALLNDKQAQQALAMADDRNMTVHTYNEGLADQIYARLPEYAQLIHAWLQSMARKLQELEKPD